ncbi:MAG: hypothetical protein Q9183_001084 [Haloplaca sp. 2 TL-2023]
MLPSITTGTITAAIWLILLSSIVASSDEHILLYRQNVPIGTGVSASSSPTNAPAAPSSAVTPVAATPTSASPDDDDDDESTTVAVETISDSPSASPTADEQSADEQSTTQAPDEDNTASSPDSVSTGAESTITSTSGPQSINSSEDDTESVSLSVSSQTQEFLTTVVTRSGSSTLTNVFTTSGLVAVSTSSSTSRGKATEQNDSEGGSGASGLDGSQKRIVIGVVVGIGGAILLGGIAVVAWRVWGRKGKAADDDNDLMDSHPGSSGHEKRSSVSGQSPFRSTLDQYHHQPGPVNTASNF